MWKRKSKSAPFLFPPELVPEPTMTVSRWREYAMMVYNHPTVTPDNSWYKTESVQPGDTVVIRFYDWDLTYTIKIIDWEEFDNEREKWESTHTVLS